MLNYYRAFYLRGEEKVPVKYTKDESSWFIYTEAHSLDEAEENIMGFIDRWRIPIKGTLLLGRMKKKPGRGYMMVLAVPDFI